MRLCIKERRDLKALTKQMPLVKFTDEAPHILDRARDLQTRGEIPEFEPKSDEYARGQFVLKDYKQKCEMGHHPYYTSSPIMVEGVSYQLLCHLGGLGRGTGTHLSVGLYKLES